MSRKPNRTGCMPSEDVCMAHHMPLECRHGCSKALPHKCKDREWQDEVLKKAGLDGNDGDQQP